MSDKKDDTSTLGKEGQTEFETPEGNKFTIQKWPSLDYSIWKLRAPSKVGITMVATTSTLYRSPTVEIAFVDERSGTLIGDDYLNINEESVEGMNPGEKDFFENFFPKYIDRLNTLTFNNSELHNLNAMFAKVFPDVQKDE